MVNILVESDREEIIYIITKILEASGIVKAIIPVDVIDIINLSDDKFSRDPAKSSPSLN